MWHLATSKGRKVLVATQTWRSRPGIPGKRYDPYLPSPGSGAPGRDLRPPPEGRQGPRAARGCNLGACERGNNRVRSGNVSAGPPDPSSSPAASGRLVPHARARRKGKTMRMYICRACSSRISLRLSRGAMRLRRQVQCWPRLPAKSCSLRGGRRGPQAGAGDPLSLRAPPPTGVAPCSSRAAAAARGSAAGEVA